MIRRFEYTQPALETKSSEILPIPSSELKIHVTAPEGYSPAIIEKAIARFRQARDAVLPHLLDPNQAKISGLFSSTDKELARIQRTVIANPDEFQVQPIDGSLPDPKDKYHVSLNVLPNYCSDNNDGFCFSFPLQGHQESTNPGLGSFMKDLLSGKSGDYLGVSFTIACLKKDISSTPVTCDVHYIPRTDFSIRDQNYPSENLKQSQRAIDFITSAAFSERLFILKYTISPSSISPEPHVRQKLNYLERGNLLGVARHISGADSEFARGIIDFDYRAKKVLRYKGHICDIKLPITPHKIRDCITVASQTPSETVFQIDTQKIKEYNQFFEKYSHEQIRDGNAWTWSGALARVCDYLAPVKFFSIKTISVPTPESPLYVYTGAQVGQTSSQLVPEAVTSRLKLATANNQKR